MFGAATGRRTDEILAWSAGGIRAGRRGMRWWRRVDDGHLGIADAGGQRHGHARAGAHRLGHAHTSTDTDTRLYYTSTKTATWTGT